MSHEKILKLVIKKFAFNFFGFIDHRQNLKKI